MRNLLPFRPDNPISVFDSILNRMSDPTLLANINGCRSVVVEQFENYQKNYFTNSLENIITQIEDIDSRVSLEKMYSSRKREMIELKRLVCYLNGSNNISICPYCMIDTVRTLDHIMPKNNFPEFSVYTYNLVPCCYDCNQRKSNQWIVGEIRSSINFYTDIIPDIQFLFANVTTNDGILNIEYYLENTVENTSLFSVIKLHFETLDLLDRYKERSVGELGAIKSLYASLLMSNIEKAETIRNYALGLQSIFGKNYWKAVIYLAIAENVQVIE